MLESALWHHSINARVRQSTDRVRAVRRSPDRVAVAARNGQHVGAMADHILYSFRRCPYVPARLPPDRCRTLARRQRSRPATCCGPVCPAGSWRAPRSTARPGRDQPLDRRVVMNDFTAATSTACSAFGRVRAWFPVGNRRARTSDFENQGSSAGCLFPVRLAHGGGNGQRPASFGAAAAMKQCQR